jgi:hypothetical protein
MSATLTICCPAPTALPNNTTSTTNCPTEFGQIRKLIFWRRDNLLDAVASATSATVWTALLTATDDTKAVVTPFLTCIIPPSEKREAGSGSEVPNGIPIAIGNNPSMAEGTIWQAGQDVIALIKDLQCEYLDVLFINEAGQLGYNLDGTDVKGFPIDSLNISDLGVGSFDEGTKNPYSFYLRANWSDGFRISTETTFLIDSVNS